MGGCAIAAGVDVAAAVGTAPLARCHCVHHQSIDRLADGLTTVGTTADGVVHAVEHDASRWVVAVQWHPEDTAVDDERQQALFDALVQQASAGLPVW